MKYEEGMIEKQRGRIVRKNTLMNRIRSGWDTVGLRDGPTPAGIHSSPPRSASTVILQGQWLSLKEKYWQAEQSSMSAADLQFDCHHYLMLWTQHGGGGRRGYSQLAERQQRSTGVWFTVGMWVRVLESQKKTRDDENSHNEHTIIRCVYHLLLRRNGTTYPATSTSNSIESSVRLT